MDGRSVVNNTQGELPLHHDSNRSTATTIVRMLRHRGWAGKTMGACRQKLGGGGGGLRLLAKLGGALIKTPETIITHKTKLHSGEEGGAYNMLTHRHYSCILTRANERL